MPQRRRRGSSLDTQAGDSSPVKTALFRPPRGGKQQISASSNLLWICSLFLAGVAFLWLFYQARGLLSQLFQKPPLNEDHRPLQP